MAAAPVNLQQGEFDEAPAQQSPAAPVSLNAGEFEEAAPSTSAPAMPKNTALDQFEGQQKTDIASRPLIAPPAATPIAGFPTKTPQSPVNQLIEQTSGPSYRMQSNAPAPTNIGEQARSFQAGSHIVPVERDEVANLPAQPDAHADMRRTQEDRFIYGPDPNSERQQDVNRGIGHEQSQQMEDELSAAQDVSGVGGAKTAVNGVQDIVGQTGEPFDRAKAIGGLTKLIAGGSQVALRLTAPQIGGIVTEAVGGNALARVAIAKLVAESAAGVAASKVGGEALDKHTNLSPETKDLIRTGLFFLPGTFGSIATAAGFKGGVGLDVEGNPAAGLSSPQGTVRAGVRGTPTAYEANVAVGSTRFGVKVPRPQPVPDAARIQAGEQQAAATATATKAAIIDKAAADKVAGVPPPPPPPQPAKPAGMDQGTLTQATVQNAAEIIKALPADKQAGAMLEAHGNLAKWMVSTGRFVGPDGKLQVADTPQKADKLAQDVLNAEVDRQTSAAQEKQKQVEAQAKEQEKQKAEAAKAAAEPNENGLTPQEQLGARVKTILEANPKVTSHAEQVATVAKHLAIDTPTASRLVATAVATQQPTVGNGADATTEESRATIDAQLAALAKGDIHTVMLPEGSKYRPQVPQGAKVVRVTGDVPGAGTYITTLRAATVKEAAKAGTHGDLLGHLETKEDLADNKPQVVVQAKTPAGTVIQDSQVHNHPEMVGRQAEILHERHPEATISVAKPEEVIKERQAALEAEAKKPEPVELQAGEFEQPNEVAQSNTNSERKGGRGQSPEQVSGESSGNVASPEPTERRTDATHRKEVSSMSPEEMRRELLTSSTVELPNRRAFDEAQKGKPAAAIAMSDADGLKALNDKFGYEAGDQLLRAKAESLKESGLDAYHDKGDEFLYRGESKSDLESKLKTARESLRSRIIEVTTKDGKTLRFQGADFSFGTGGNLDAAESGLKQHKSEREASGERARGELRGISEVGPEKREIDKGAAIAKGDTVTFRDRQGIERTGKVAHTDGVIVRIKSEGKEYTVPRSRAAKASNEVEKRVVDQADRAPTLAKNLYYEIVDGRMPKDNNALRAQVAAYDGKAPDQVRMKLAQEAMEEAIVERGRRIIAETGKDSKAIFTDLVKLYESQPNLNIRTSTSVANQAYSTPAPLAYLADLLAGIDAKATVYEPTAGNGMLLIGATPKNATAGELEKGRAAALRSQGFKVLEGDATKAQIPEKSVDAVVANPPFGPTEAQKFDGFKFSQIDQLIAAKALKAMKDDGRATLILGAKKMAGEVGTGADRIFFNYLYSHYNVVDHFELDGDLYSRQGASWPVRVIAIEGRQASNKVTPQSGTIDRLKTWDEAYERTNTSLDAQRGRQPEAEPSGAPSSVEQTEPGGVQRPAGEPPAAVDRGESEGSTAVARSESGGSPGPSGDSNERTDQPVRPGPDDVGPDADVARSNRMARGEPRQPRGNREPAKPVAGNGSDSLTSEDNQFQVGYTPASSKKDAGVLIPTNMRSPLEQWMRKLEDRVGDIDNYVADELGYDSIDDLHEAFMGLQVDSIASAIYQIKEGKAAIIGDQTGIGKGRQAAAILRWALKNDKIPVFLTVKDQLFTDMYGDLKDIGTTDLKPFLMNSDASITLPSGEKVFRNSLARHRATIDKIAATGKLPDGSNGLFLTYSQINTSNTQRQALDALSTKAVIVLDESHNAGGASGTGEFVQGLLSHVAGAAYLSATYAKRPDNMPVYFKTDIGKAVGDAGSLDQAMASGGLPLQTVVSNNLVKAGQFFRRERSYDGIKFHSKVLTAKRKEHVKIADSATKALRAITDADRLFHHIFVKEANKLASAQGKGVEGGGNKADAGVQHTEFSSVVHNFVRQMLLGLKAEEAANDAIERIKQGEKPLIALENTMGSFLQEFSAANNLSPGDSLKDLDYNTVLSRALKRSRAIIEKLPNGDEVKRSIPLTELDPITRAAYDKAQRVIDSLEINLPVSPVDWIRHLIEEAGHTVQEITGRNLAIDYADPDDPKLKQVDQEEQKDKVKTTRSFNGGKTDALVLNVSGSTGISLHASERFKDQRPRHMIVVQPAQDINIFMQMLGRIHRTGQVVLPGYTILSADLPAEKRPNAMLSRKMKSLNANTSSNTESATSVEAVDMFNKYGDEIVEAYLTDNPDLALKLNVDPKEEGIAKKATGRLAILPVKEQEEFYNDVEQQYRDKIDYLNQTNQNDLEPKTFDYDAKALHEQVLVEGTDKSSPFGEDAIFGRYSIKMQGKPVEPEEVKASIAETLGDKTPQQFAQGLLDELNPQFDEYIKTLEPGSAEGSKARETAQRAANFIRYNRVGQAIRVEVNDDLYSGVITKITNAHKGTGNPYAMSKFKVFITTNGALHRIAPAATEFERIFRANLPDRIDGMFGGHNPDARETANLITGNLLSAFAEITKSGRIINFTKADGTTEQGILLPKKFDVKEDTRGDLRVAKAEDVVKILRDSRGKTAEEFGISTRDGIARVIRKDSGNLQIIVPKSKARGGRYFLNERLVAAAGDFVSTGNQMRADLTKQNEVAAIDELQKINPLYAPPSMVEEARSVIQKGQDKKGNKEGVVLRSSFLGAEKLVEFMAETGAKFYEKDIHPAIEKLGPTLTKASRQVTDILYPRIGANEDALDSLMKAKGDREQHRVALENIDKGLDKFFDKMPTEAQIAFMDRAKLGVSQLGKDKTQTQKLDEIRVLMEDLNAESTRRMLEYKPNMALRDHYYGMIWKTIPDAEGKHAATNAARAKSGFTGQGKRPFEGSKGFMKRSTLEDITEGINMGGEPITHNPWKMFRLVEAQKMQYITAQDHWKRLKELGLRKFVRHGEKKPEGWKPLDDRLAKTFFPATSGEGMVHAGDWYLEHSAALLLNNYLSRDLIRENAIGNALMLAKNLSTGLELSLSPFHLMFESLEAMGSQLGLGVQRFWNTGVREGSATEAAKGLGDAATFMAAPFLIARSGGSMLKMIQSPQDFANTKRGLAFLKKYPNAPALLADLYSGGLTWGMNEDYRTDPIKSLRESAKEGNYVGTMLRALPALNQTIMHPLFGVLIPRLKWGLALAQLSQQYAEEAEALANGDTTREKIARQVVDTVENRLGELNFSNLFWNNTFKSIMQFIFRSVTWKLGNWRGLGSALGPEARAAFVDPLKAMYEDVRSGKKTHQTKDYIPRMGPNQAWLFGMIAMTTMLGTIFAKLVSGKYPWEHAEEDARAGYNAAGAWLLESIHPRTGKANKFSGKPERVSLPTGLKDFEHAAHSPKQYVNSSLSSTVGRFVDISENRDFFGNYVYDPNGSYYRKAAEIFSYAVPRPIGLENWNSEFGSQDIESKAMRFAGFNASSSQGLDNSPAEQRMADLAKAAHTPKTPEQVHSYRERDNNAKPTVAQMRSLIKHGNKEYVQAQFEKLGYADARDIYNNYATPREKAILKDILNAKRLRALKKDVKQGTDRVAQADAN